MLVTGASSGLGAELARQLARDFGAHLVLVARRVDRLAALGEELGAFGSEVRVIEADLGRDGEVERVFEEATSAAPLHAAFLNAGVTHFGHHDELDFPSFEKMLELNVRSTARFLSLLLPYLEERGENGGVQIVASLAGLTPVSYQAAYSGTKAFLVNYGCSLHHEMKPRGVTVSVFAPGGIQTEMTAGERFNDLRTWLVKVEPCARECIQGLQRRAYLTVPGFIYRWGSRLTRLLPQSFLVGRVAAQYRHSLTRNA